MGIYGIMFYGGLVLAILLFIVSIILFFVLKIPEALGVVTGSAQKKAIEEIRQGGKLSGGKRVKGSFISTRDIDVISATTGTLGRNKTGSITGGKSGEMTGEKTGGLSGSTGKNTKRSTDASGVIAEKAAADAKKAVETSNMEMLKKSLDEDNTEVLTYSEMKKKDSGEGCGSPSIV